MESNNYEPIDKNQCIDCTYKNGSDKCVNCKHGRKEKGAYSEVEFKS